MKQESNDAVDVVLLTDGTLTYNLKLLCGTNFREIKDELKNDGTQLFLPV